MTEIIRLDPHDPLPDAKPFALVIRRFGEDDPNAIVTEIDFMGAHPTAELAMGPGGDADGVGGCGAACQAGSGGQGLCQALCG